jgi:hypothetical protein
LTVFSTGAKLARDLLVALARDDVLEHFALPRRERREAPPRFRQSPACAMRNARPFSKRIADRGEKILVVDRLRQEVRRAAFHRLHAGRTSPCPVRNTIGSVLPRAGQLLLQFHAVQAGHREVEHEAGPGHPDRSAREIAAAIRTPATSSPAAARSRRRPFSTEGSSSTRKTSLSGRSLRSL